MHPEVITTYQVSEPEKASGGGRRRLFLLHDLQLLKGLGAIYWLKGVKQAGPGRFAAA